jgi:hypothetical protein
LLTFLFSFSLSFFPLSFISLSFFIPFSSSPFFHVLCFLSSFYSTLSFISF